MLQEILAKTFSVTKYWVEHSNSHQENSFDSRGCWADGNGLNWYLPPTTQLPVMQNH